MSGELGPEVVWAQLASVETQKLQKTRRLRAQPWVEHKQPTRTIEVNGGGGGSAHFPSRKVRLAACNSWPLFGVQAQLNETIHHLSARCFSNPLPESAIHICHSLFGVISGPGVL